MACVKRDKEIERYKRALGIAIDAFTLMVKYAPENIAKNTMQQLMKEYGDLIYKSRLKDDDLKR